MKKYILAISAAVSVMMSFSSAAVQPALPPADDCGPILGKLKTVDIVNCGDPADTHEFRELTPNNSSTAKILGQPCRVMPNTGDEPKYFAYLMGKNKNLEAGKGYVLAIDYPDDKPRSFFIMNMGCETTRGLHTGPTVGDCLHAPYVGSNPESLSIPLSGNFQTWKTLFYLHDRFSELKISRDKAVRPMSPKDGFWVIIIQYGRKNAPLSDGTAVTRIRLLEAPQATIFTADYNRPPKDLPQRHIFWREEMSDGVIGSQTQSERGVNNDKDWYEYKARLMDFLAIDTFSKDLLEFGSNQGWDAAPSGGNDWCYGTPYSNRWKEILEISRRHNLYVLPYYEYCGSKGAKGYGFEKRCKPLGGGSDYTHIEWTEKANADVTDPDTLTDVKKFLDCTIVRFKDSADFAGAWFRTRPSALPMSFSDKTLARFKQEKNVSGSVTRDLLKTDKNLMEQYKKWWFDKRRAFLISIRDYLKSSGVQGTDVLFTWDASEPGRGCAPGGAVVTDNPSPWAGTGEKIIELDKVAGEEMYLKTLLSPPGTWGKWEWQYSLPEPDPDNYRNVEGVMLTLPFNRSFTVASTNAFAAFRSGSGLAIIRHYCLNENSMTIDKTKDPVGYFVSDMEYAGPYCMLGEARAMALGDPQYIGYLVSASFNRGFPEYVRKFNQNFLALPALPSRIIKDSCSDNEIVVRAINAGRYGIYMAIINTSLQPKRQISIRVPAGGYVYEADTGKRLGISKSGLVLSLYPCELKSLLVCRSFPVHRRMGGGPDIRDNPPPGEGAATPDSASLKKSFGPQKR